MISVSTSSIFANATFVTDLCTLGTSFSFKRQHTETHIQSTDDAFSATDNAGAPFPPSPGILIFHGLTAVGKSQRDNITHRRTCHFSSIFTVPFNSLLTPTDDDLPLLPVTSAIKISVAYC